MSTTIYDLTADIAAIQAAAEDGELPPEMELALELTTENLHEKVDGYCRVLVELDGEADMLKTEIDRLSDRLTARINAAKRLKDNLKAGLERIGEKRVKTPFFSIWVQASPPSVSVEDEEKLPAKYIRMKIEANKAALLRDWKDGKELPSGVTVTQGNHLRIN